MSHFEYKVEILVTPVSIRNRYIEWLYENIGDYTIDWNYSATSTEYGFSFKRIEDGMAFKLRWL